MKTKIIFALLLSVSSSISLAAGEVFKLNTSGTQYCPGFKPIVFTAINDIDLWVRIESTSSATVFTDLALTNPVADLDIVSAFFASNKASFSAFYGDSFGHIAVVGTLIFDPSGQIKTIKGTLVRRGLLNFCYSKGKVNGNRIN